MLLLLLCLRKNLNVEDILKSCRPHLLYTYLPMNEDTHTPNRHVEKKLYVTRKHFIKNLISKEIPQISTTSSLFSRVPISKQNDNHENSYIAVKQP